MERQRDLLVGGTMLLSLFGFLGFRINSVVKHRNDKMAFAKALIYAQEAERKRIARDLPGGIGQSLLLLKKQLQVTHSITHDNSQMLTETLEEVRSISRDLDPFQLEKFGLTATVEDRLHKVAQSTSIFISKEIENIDDLLSEEAQLQAYRTIQEALNNIIKHAEASAIKVVIKKAPQNILLQILDNGKGFDQEIAIVKSKSLGLKTMNERVQSLNGQFKIQKNIPSGTQILIKLPLKEV